MRICFLSSMHPVTDKRVFDKEARSLAQAGFDVVHLAPDHEQQRDRQWQQDGVSMVTYVPRKGLKGRFLGLLDLFGRAKRLKADVYHCNEVDSWVVGVALRLLIGRRCVFDVHEHYPEEFAEKRIPNWARPLVRVSLAGFMRVLSWFTVRIVVAKKSLLHDFPDKKPEHVLAVQNFVPVAELPEPGGEQKSQDSMRLVHLGLLNRYRGWPQLLEAMANARCKSTSLEVIGDINDGSKPEFHARVEALGLTDRVNYQDWLPFDQAIEKVRDADVGVICFQPGFFNHVHALPHKLFDYMGTELAVLVPDIAVEVREIIEDAECGFLIDASDSQSIADAIDRYCDDPAQMRAMGQRGRQAVLDRYNWENEAMQLVAMYRELEAA